MVARSLKHTETSPWIGSRTAGSVKIAKILPQTAKITQKRVEITRKLPL
jgi:hypothetical protein